MSKYFFAVTLLISSISSWACSCSEPNLEYRVANSKTVLVGRVVKLEEVFSEGVSHMLKGTIQVKEQLKGEVVEELTLHTGFGQGDCGLGFRVRDEFIFFLNDQKSVISCEGHIINFDTGSRPSCFSSELDYGFPTYEEQLSDVKRLIDNGI